MSENALKLERQISHLGYQFFLCVCVVFVVVVVFWGVGAGGGGLNSEVFGACLVGNKALTVGATAGRWSGSVHRHFVATLSPLCWVGAERRESAVAGFLFGQRAKLPKGKMLIGNMKVVHRQYRTKKDHELWYKLIDDIGSQPFTEKNFIGSQPFTERNDVGSQPFSERNF